MKKRLIVTGGAGFIGSHIASRLISEGFDVLILDNLSTGKEGNIPGKADFIKLDLGKESSYDRLKDFSCLAVFHLAGQSSGEASFRDPFYDLESHAMSTFWLLDWCRKKRVSRFVYASSMAVYGDPAYLPVDEGHPFQPKTFYGSAKIAAEAYVRLYQTLGVDTTIFRMFSVYGPGQDLENRAQGILSIYLSYLMEGAPIVVKGSPDRFRDLVYIDDVVDAWATALDDPRSYGKTYNIATGKKTRVRDMIALLAAAFGHADYPVEYRSGTPGDQFGIIGDISLIRRELGWEPKIPLSEGLARMANDAMREKREGAIR